MAVTLAIILITAAVSILCFNGRLDINAWMFNASQVWHRRQWCRMFSCGLVFPILLFTHFLSQVG